MKTSEKFGVMIALILSVLLTAITVAAQQEPTGPDSLNRLSDERANLSQSALNTSAQAGNVTELALDATAITEAWQGYFGNITGTITLEDSSGSVFYNWTGLGSISGEVFASRDNNVDWSTIACGTPAEISNETTFLGKTASSPDSVQNTFNNQDHPTFTVGQNQIGNNTCNSTNAYDNTGAQNTNFYQVFLADGNGDGDPVYTTLIDEDQNGFDNAQHDFELLVGENGNESEADSTTLYHFYIELS